jgi:hypothetical protein
MEAGNKPWIVCPELVPVYVHQAPGREGIPLACRPFHWWEGFVSALELLLQLVLLFFDILEGC